MARPALLSLTLWLSLACVSFSQAGNLTVRVVDVGAGLCCVAKTPDGHYFVYDAGNYVDRGFTAMTAIEEIIPAGADIDLLVVSHGDADHLAAVPYICENYRVRQVWREGLRRTTATWDRANRAIRDEVTNDGCIDRNLQSSQAGLSPGDWMNIGAEATATFLCGFRSVPASWGLPRDSGEDVNARSVVVRLDFGESSILFGGDTVGRRIDDPWWRCIAAEEFLVNNAFNVPIDVDVVIAPHHGADNGSSTRFIEATSPRYVIFSAGSDHRHPRAATATRYLFRGVSADRMFRTDRGDNEGGTEWASTPGASPDPMGDDDIDVVMRRNGSISVSYRPLAQPLFSPRAFAMGAARATNDPDVGQRISPAIGKWIENDELWTETHEHLEDHTLSRAEHGARDPQRMQPFMGPSTGYSAAPSTTCCCQAQRRCGFHRRHRRFH